MHLAYALISLEIYPPDGLRLIGAVLKVPCLPKNPTRFVQKSACGNGLKNFCLALERIARLSTLQKPTGNLLGAFN